MEELSIFVDESGRFQHPDTSSRFYILGMVFHDQACDISQSVADLDRAEEELGLENHCFHAGPLIRKEKGYETFIIHAPESSRQEIKMLTETSATSPVPPAVSPLSKPFRNRIVATTFRQGYVVAWRHVPPR